MSPKEQVLQTLLTAARGEITALTEANKLLAAQVAASEVKQSWIIHDPQGVIARLRAAAMSLHDAVNKHVAADDRTSLGVAFEEMDNAMAEAVFDDAPVSAQATPVAPSWNQLRDAVTVLRGALVSAECAIKGREHTGFITKALNATAFPPAKVSVRAADALDSQPTVPAGWKLVPIEPTDAMYFAACHAFHAWRYTTSEQPDFTHRDTYRAMLTAVQSASASSQPTDGEVRNG